MRQHLQVGALLVLVGCTSAAPPRQADSSRQRLLDVVAASSHASSGVRSNEELSSELSPAARVALDSGNTLYRARKFREALVQYRLTAERSPGDATAYFGIQMVAEALHDTTLANSAVETLRELGASIAKGHAASSASVPSRP